MSHIHEFGLCNESKSVNALAIVDEGFGRQQCRGNTGWARCVRVRYQSVLARLEALPWQQAYTAKR